MLLKKNRLSISQANWAFALVFLLLDLLFGALTVSAHTGNIISFSLRHVITPLVGIWGGAVSVLILFFGKGLIHACTAIGSRLLLFWHLPTLCGALYLSLIRKNSWHTKIISALPALVCMALFWIHPIGRCAALYPLYWIIPIAVAVTRPQAFFLHALGSTFTTHAVGSVLWLYGGLLCSPVAWNALIPIVAFERFGFACMMTGVFYGIRGARSWLNKTKKPLFNACTTLFRNRQNP